MQHIIYFGSKPLYLTDEVTEEIKPFWNDRDVIQLENVEDTNLSNLLNQIQTSASKGGIILYQPAKALEAIKKHFELIIAAGGLVFTEKKEVLLIFRRKKWDLPKGKLDEGESIATCALREVMEETGLQKVRLDSFLGVTYHTYHQEGQAILKESHWYAMQAQPEQALVPQLDEDIERCEWVKIDELKPYLENSHRSIVDILLVGKEYLDKAK